MTKVFRQKDEEFQALLRDIRYVSPIHHANAQGKVSQRSRTLLQRLERNELRNFSMRGIRTNPKWCARVLREE